MSNSYILPAVQEGSCLELLHFPTRMQAFIFRNWELVDKSRIAKVLKVDVDTVNKIAFDMGLPAQRDVSVFLKRGYITIIKQNWHILPYAQLLELLDWTEEKLAYILKEDDFLSVKLENFKFDCKPVVYEALNDTQIAETQKIAATVKELWKDFEKEPFDFFSREEPVATTDSREIVGVRLTNEWGITDLTNFERAKLFAGRFKEDLEKQYGICLAGSACSIILKYENVGEKPESHCITVAEGTITIAAVDEVGILRGLNWLLDKMSESGTPTVPFGIFTRIPRFNTRIIYSYHGLYGSVFDEDIEVSYSDEMLREYARLGVNGIWAQGVLYKLTEFPYNPSMSEGYQSRQEKIRCLIKKAADYGIKVYLYLCEPRAMPIAFFDQYPHLKGVVEGDYASMCTSVPEVRDYLYNATAALCRATPGLGGFFTISLGENFTNCWSRVFSGDCVCPRCSKRTPHDVVAETNNVIYQAIRSVDPSMKMIVWTWGWTGTKGTSDEDCIRQLPKDISIMNVSEESMPFNIAGAQGIVVDYTMSLPAPGERAKNIWAIAQKYGKETAAKIQINNTWECSTVPYIPVFGLISGHIQRLSKVGVDDLMLSWTLGGAPSPNIKMISQYFFYGDEETTDMLSSIYGGDADKVSAGTKLLDTAFQEFPFSVYTAYYGPQFSSTANLLFSKSSGHTATMTGFPYDDVMRWCGPYTPAALENQFKKLSEGWEKGLHVLSDIADRNLTDVATACYALFRSSYNQIKYIRLRELGDTKGLIEILEEEEKLALSLYEITLRQPMIGYEAANHYVYTPQMCLEKILNCRKLKTIFGA